IPKAVLVNDDNVGVRSAHPNLRLLARQWGDGMGLKRFLARSGTVGGTARWAGELYLKLKKQDLGADITDVMKQLLEWRYDSPSSTARKKAMIKLVDSGRVFGLAHLITNILTIEARYRDCSQRDRFLFMEV